MTQTLPARILVIDDTLQIHNDFRKILMPAPTDAALDSIEDLMLDSGGLRRSASPSFEVHFASQGQEGLAMLQAASGAGRPFALAFVDMHMPPGWDGVETVEHLWMHDPRLQIVICTAFSDHPWESVFERLDVRDRLLVVKKPFDVVEISQVARTLTEKWRLARNADRHVKDLEIAVAARTSDLAGALDAALTASRAKGEFLANMSHEIRTPMNAITGLLHLALRTDLSTQQRDYLAKAQDATRHLLGIVNDVLDFSKVEAGKLALDATEFDVHLMVGDVVSILSQRAAAKGLELAMCIDSAVPRRVTGDPLRIRQVLINFLDNAIKFTETGLVGIDVRADAFSGGASLLRFDVHDTGIGVSAAQIEKLFGPFEQADSSCTRRFGGTGLGLAISRKLARLMGGEAGVSSEPGAGSTFWFTARVSAAPEELRPVVVDQALPRLQGRVLLVEDNDINQMVACEIIHSTGLDVDVATNGALALAMLNDTHDLVLMDMQMPVMDGLEATRAIRAMSRRAHLPIIAMTANVLPEDRVKCTAAGMNDFIAKPFDPQEFCRLLEMWIPKSKLLQSAPALENL